MLMLKREKFINAAEAELKINPVATIGKKAGPEIEKYLAEFRPFLVDVDGSKPYMDINMGFDWCGAFVWYCCRKMGIDIKPAPFSGKPTFALVRTWFDYAIISDLFEWLENNESPQAGDIIIYRNLSKVDSEFNHIGIIIETGCNKVTTVEGNMPFFDSNGVERSCIKKVVRDIDDKIKGYIRIK